MEEFALKAPDRSMATPSQMPTGIEGLDQLLGGGLRPGGLHVVVGAPGMGKTVLAHQIGANLIRAGGKVLYLTALIETHQMLIAQARSFDFFDPSVVPGSFYYASLYPVMGKGGLQAVREEISRLVSHHNPTLLIIDGVHALKATSEGSLDYQRFMHEMEAQAAVAGLTTLLLAHPPEGSVAADATFTIADAIFHMTTRASRLRDVRLFSVRKLRGVNHVGGWHAFRIAGEGIRIFPRGESLLAPDEAQPSEGGELAPSTGQLVKTGVAGLNGLLGGGLDRDSISLVLGTPGSGKTLLGLAVLDQGWKEGENGLFIGYREKPNALLQKADSVGLRLREGVGEGKVRFYWRHPSEMLIDEEIDTILRLVRAHKITRVVVDALEDLTRAVFPSGRKVAALGALSEQLRRNEVTTIFLQDLHRIVGLNFDLPMAEISGNMDNALHLRYVERKGEMVRLIAILKVRARSHDHGLREFSITDKGLSVGKLYTDAEMLLTGLGLVR